MNSAVLMAVYRQDDPEALIEAIDTISVGQTQKPDLIQIVLDGPVPDALRQALSMVTARAVCPIESIELPENRGLRAGVEALRGRVRYVVRTDADDLSRPNRIAEQVAFMDAHPKVGVASAQVAIFEGQPENRTGQRYLPEDGSIHQFARSRTPINHSAAILRMAALENLNYPETRLPFEDWWISLRLLKAGWNIGVIPAEHLDFRGGIDMIARRRGWRYARQEIAFFRLIHAEGLMSTPLVMKNLVLRLGLRMFPAGLMKTFYTHVMHR
jgi:hypothetical protein